ncbi:membrane protein [Streptomyces phaeofaciens JCM 4814]|uniref:Membrane protein n=1 Tax=Streptomyces phaeofaciens TaxID=68254 RepID=A0A918LPN6_9ACTN|nr:Flp family type IVb pilin [Streptomyces phaeofaciens]GGT35680.1 membrane protein [Streptomyces phaeofaciens]
MSDLLLKTAVAAKVRVSGWTDTTVAAVRRRSASADDKGQTAVEYLGIIAVVVAIVVLIANTNLGQTIVDKLTTQIGKVAP